MTKPGSSSIKTTGEESSEIFSETGLYVTEGMETILAGKYMQEGIDPSINSWNISWILDQSLG
jgi:hypothetical protein